MWYISVEQIAKKWGISPRSVRNYCANERIEGAFLTGKMWLIPDNAKKPERINAAKKPMVLLNTLLDEMKNKTSGGIYEAIQIDFAFESNAMADNKLTRKEVEEIYKTNTFNPTKKSYNTDDIIETINHFKCFDLMLENVSKKLNETFIKKLHFTLKNGTTDTTAGEYKKLPHKPIYHTKLALPEAVPQKMKALLKKYNEEPETPFYDILEFHSRFERIHPFQDGNGRVGRLIMFKESLKNNFIPCIIENDIKLFYYNGFDESGVSPYLRDSYKRGQERVMALLDQFNIPHDED